MKIVLYLLIINVIGYLMALLDTKMAIEKEKRINKILIFICIIGGALGIMIEYKVKDEPAEKSNMITRVFAPCMLIIWIVCIILFFKMDNKKLDLNIVGFLIKHKLLIWYILIINVITFAAFGIDKLNAIKDKSRIPIVTLLGLSFIGGTIGGIIAMYTFRHKIRKDYFRIGMPLILITQIFVLVLLMNIF